MEKNDVWADIEVTNAADEYFAADGNLPKDKVRRVDVSVLAESDNTFLVLPEKDIKALGLQFQRTIRNRFSNGEVRKVDVYGPVTVRFGMRTMQTEAMQAPSNIRPLLGQIPMTCLGVIVDTKNNRLVLNLESGRKDMAMIEMFGTDY